VVLNCDPPRTCAEGNVNGAVICDSCFTPGTPRLFATRAAANPLSCVAFALAPPTVGCMKYWRIVVAAAQAKFGLLAQSAANVGGIVTVAPVKFGNPFPVVATNVMPLKI